MKKTYQILNILGFIGVLVMNYLANALPLGGRSTKEVSDMFASLFTPAPFTFAIWGVIYLLLAVFIVVQSKGLLQKDQPPNDVVEAIGPWFFINCLANMSWLLAWHHLKIGLSFCIIVVMLYSLIAIYQRLQIGRFQPPARIKYGVHLPFSIYLGWLTVATIANASAFLLAMHWEGFGIAPRYWTVYMLMVGTFLGLLLLFRRKDIGFALVLIWAFFGIYVAVNENEKPSLIANAAAAFAVLLALGIIIKIGRRLANRKKVA